MTDVERSIGLTTEDKSDSTPHRGHDLRGLKLGESEVIEVVGTHPTRGKKWKVLCRGCGFHFFRYTVQIRRAQKDGTFLSCRTCGEEARGGGKHLAREARASRRIDMFRHTGSLYSARYDALFEASFREDIDDWQAPHMDDPGAAGIGHEELSSEADLYPHAEAIQNIFALYPLDGGRTRAWTCDTCNAKKKEHARGFACTLCLGFACIECVRAERHKCDTDELSLRTVGNAWDVSRERIRQIEIDALRKLRERLLIDERPRARVPTTPPARASTVVASSIGDDIVTPRAARERIRPCVLSVFECASGSLTRYKSIARAVRAGIDVSPYSARHLADLVFADLIREGVIVSCGANLGWMLAERHAAFVRTHTSTHADVMVQMRTEILAELARTDVPLDQRVLRARALGAIGPTIAPPKPRHVADLMWKLSQEGVVTFQYMTCTYWLASRPLPPSHRTMSSVDVETTARALRAAIMSVLADAVAPATSESLMVDAIRRLDRKHMIANGQLTDAIQWLRTKGSILSVVATSEDGDKQRGWVSVKRWVDGNLTPPQQSIDDESSQGATT